jgi:hypothetical protein
LAWGRFNPLSWPFSALQSVRVAPIREDFTTDCTDCTDGKEKKRFGKQNLFIREIREIRGSFLWLRLAVLRPRAFALNRLPQSHPVTPGQTISLALTMHSKSMEVPVHQPFTYHPMKARIETSQTQSNLVKPTAHWSIGVLWRWANFAPLSQNKRKCLRSRKSRPNLYFEGSAARFCPLLRIDQ